MRRLLISLIVCITSIIFYQYQQNIIKSLDKILGRNSNASASMTSNSNFNDSAASVPQTMAVPRAIRRAFLALETPEGVGATVRRSIGTRTVRNLTPFLMLDHFTATPGAGFPDHPHRGQETITYVLSGAVDHEDFNGNADSLYKGDLQFMTAGKGIMHSEVPRSVDGENTVGMQLWVDLPQHLKYTEPRYRDLRSKEIPIAKIDDGKVEIKVISGQTHGIDSVKELAYTPVWFFDVTIKPGGKLSQTLPTGWNAFAYTLEGSTKFGSGDDAAEIEKYHNVVFEQSGDGVTAEVAEDAAGDARFILVAGQPLDQRIVQYGPFVCTSEQEVYQAMNDYHGNENGFERAMGWKSKIGEAFSI